MTTTTGLAKKLYKQGEIDKAVEMLNCDEGLIAPISKEKGVELLEKWAAQEAEQDRVNKIFADAFND